MQASSGKRELPMNGDRHVLEVLAKCVRELSVNRLTVAIEAGGKPGDITPCRAETEARAILAEYIEFETDEERDRYLRGKLGPETVRLKVISGGKE
jgi:hypothetical protein